MHYADDGQPVVGLLVVFYLYDASDDSLVTAAGYDRLTNAEGRAEGVPVEIPGEAQTGQYYVGCIHPRYGVQVFSDFGHR